VFGFHRRPKCSCTGDHWSWPTTRAHENFHGQVVTTTTCLKHGTVRLYNFDEMRVATMAEEHAVLAEIQAYLNRHHQEGTHANLATVAPAVV
jgi:hypothetical protein